MINLKSENEIKIMKDGGSILHEVISAVLEHAKPGVTELELEKLANNLILKRGAEPAFKRVKGYNYATCLSTNDVVVHGIPTNYKLRPGDVFGVDCGVYYKGFNTDSAWTIRIKNQESRIKNDKADKFLETGEMALNEAIKAAVAGNRIGHISKTIQGIIEGDGYSVVRSLIGHGVGRALHEDPEVPGFLDTKIEKTPLLKIGMTLAIEVIYNMGGSQVRYSEGDEWTIRTSDGSMSGLFERTVAITISFNYA
ncbi:MAG: type I methionyl aminopeptidase, partial [Patescibacteria group bacterium]|nr:type I methionyl aminopeptidase [Patescibacteria group bacterium]